MDITNVSVSKRGAASRLLGSGRDTLRGLVRNRRRLMSPTAWYRDRSCFHRLSNHHHLAGAKATHLRDRISDLRLPEVSIADRINDERKVTVLREEEAPWGQPGIQMAQAGASRRS